jgi:hypothetical protein
VGKLITTALFALVGGYLGMKLLLNPDWVKEVAFPSVSINVAAPQGSADPSPEAHRTPFVDPKNSPVETKSSPETVFRNTRKSSLTTVTDYFDKLSRRDYAGAWEMLSPGFIRIRNNLSFQEYTEFWSQYDVEITAKRSEEKGDFAEAQIYLRVTNVDGDLINGDKVVTLVKGSNGDWLIHDMR